ncbi:MAG TPA: EF-hand domain-containing protein [Candidatus Melainabacteria bacterium]|nr:EF-hand domain-containing protein [Candidatus Melainabacteria bacterium]
MSERDAYAIRETPSARMDAAELRTSIQSILQHEGNKPTYAMTVTDTSGSYLPAVEICGSNAEAKIIKAKKVAELKQEAPAASELEGGIRGLVDRADTNNDNRLSREEIVNRLGTKLSVSEARALKDVYQNFSSMDWDGNGRVSASDVEGRVRGERRAQEQQDHLAQFEKAVERNRKLIDSNHDGRISLAEVRVAGRNSQINQTDRESLRWGGRNA